MFLLGYVVHETSAAVCSQDMADKIRWIDGQASRPGNVERICPGRHIKTDQWQSDWNSDYLNDWSSHCYEYISDYECFFSYPIGHEIPLDKRLWNELQQKKRQGTAVRITDIAHFTRAGGAIIDEGGFRGGQKKFDESNSGNSVEAKFSWWNPVFTSHTADQVRGHIGAAMRPFLSNYDDEDQLKKQFATSNAFLLREERYGRFYFEYGIEELCAEYRRRCRSELDFKILGTFGYKQEVEHAVLVCSTAAGAGRFSAYPRVATPADDADRKAVVTYYAPSGAWTWKPEATATEIQRLRYHQQTFPSYRRWDHVSFAFHIPEEWNVMEVKDLAYHYNGY